MNVYVVTFKETTFDDDGTMSVNSGVKDCYSNERDAIASVWKITDDKFNEYIDEQDDNGDFPPHIYRDSTDGGKWQCFHRLNDTYEYEVVSLSVK